MNLGKGHFSETWVERMVVMTAERQSTYYTIHRYGQQDNWWPHKKSKESIFAKGRIKILLVLFYPIRTTSLFNSARGAGWKQSPWYCFWWFLPNTTQYRKQWARCQILTLIKSQPLQQAVCFGPRNSFTTWNYSRNRSSLLWLREGKLIENVTSEASGAMGIEKFETFVWTWSFANGLCENDVFTRTTSIGQPSPCLVICELTPIDTCYVSFHQDWLY